MRTLRWLSTEYPLKFSQGGSVKPTGYFKTPISGNNTRALSARYDIVSLIYRIV